MNKTVVFAVGGAIVGALAAIVYYQFGPGIAPPGGRPGTCGGNPHCIEVNVIAVGGQPRIADIADHKVHDQGAEIEWKIATPGYTFPANGIAFDKPPTPPAGEFTCSLNGGTFKCKDTYRTMGTFGYTVTLSGSPAVPVKDPYVINH